MAWSFGGRGGRRRFIQGLAAGATLGLPGADLWGVLGGRAARAAEARRPERPAGRTFDVTAFGAVPDGKTPATAAIQKAVEACAAAGGGTVVVPAGRFLSGAIFLRSNLEFHLAPGAVLLASQRFDDFPPMQGRWEGIERTTYSSLLTGIDLENVVVSGAGLLDGQGAPWWTAFGETRKLRVARGLRREDPDPPEAPLKWPCPRLVNLVRCARVAVKGLSFENAPSWNLHLLYCQDAVVEGVNILGLQSQEACGVVVDSCKRTRISDCSISSGADCLCLKAGYNEDGRRVGLPCEDVLVTNCHLYDSGSAAVSIGSETAGWIRNIAISSCTISNMQTAFHLRSTRGRGGGIERVRVSNIVADHLRQAAVVVLPFYDSVRGETYFTGLPLLEGNPETNRALRVPADEGTPTFRDLAFSDLILGKVPDVATIEGLPERFVENLSIADVHAPAALGGVSCMNATHVRLRNLALEPTQRPMVAARNVIGLEIAGLSRSRPNPKLPVLAMENVTDAFVHGCNVGGGPGEFLHARPGAVQRLTLSDNVEPTAPESASGAATPGRARAR